MRKAAMILTSLAFLSSTTCSQSTDKAPKPSTANIPAAMSTVSCGPAVFVTLESGKLAGVNWVERNGNVLHTRSVLTQSMTIDATIDLRLDGTALKSSTLLNMAGGEPMKPNARDLPENSIYWSDMVASSVEQTVIRARILNQSSAHISAASLFSNSHGEVLVERIDATGWTVSYHNKRYLVLTDDNGCMISATLPEHGVVIERRAEFAPSQYPSWAPHAAPPDAAYRAADVKIPAAQGHVLAGTFTTPLHSNGPTPAAVLITGLSPHERNNGQPPWMPFRDIADALTRAGIAVLRVDDRGVGESTGDHAPSTTFDEADDVQTEVKWLRSQPGIDPKRIALVGYSEGGLIAPMVAAKDPLIAAIITLAGPGVPGPELARYQIEAAVKGDPSIPAADREKEIAKQLADEMSPRERVFLTIDPLEFARRVKCPALVIQGGSDLTVPIRSAERIASAMRAGGNSDVTVQIFPAVSHSLLPDPVGLSSGWVLLPGFLTSPALLEIMTRWTSDHLLRH